MSARSIAEALGKAQREGKGWKSLCPIHNDHSPSLSLRDAGDKILAHCRVCGNDGQAALVDELKRRGLWPESQRKPKAEIVATYDYKDESGALRYQVVRYLPKDFKQRRPNGVGGWVWNKDGIDPLPYRLPELIAAPNDAIVFIAEGEKDVDTLRSIGAVATCNSAGAGKWPASISRWLAGRSVVILPDNDDVGRKHARDVAAKLKGVAASVRALVLPGEGKDPFDWIKAGGTFEELSHLAEEAAEDAATLAEDASIEASSDGPIPLGYTADQRFVILDPVRRVIVARSGAQLTTTGALLELAPLSYWEDRFPAKRQAFNAVEAGDALIRACRKSGPFDTSTIRGRGIWLDDNGAIVVNLGGPVPDHRYVCFQPLEITGTVDPELPQKVLKLLSRFSWRDPGNAILYLGAIAIAPICGVLDWRPHTWVLGPSRCGKTKLYAITRALTTPLCLAADGGSTEAGVRQKIKADSLPCLFDETESEDPAAIDRLRGIVRLARSASSGRDVMLRGTPEGRAMEFALRAMFMFFSINPVGMEAADENRWVKFHLEKHDSNPAVRAEIDSAIRELTRSAGSWCRMMVDRARLIPPTIEVIEPLLTGDSRHCQNMAALIAGAAIAMAAGVPTKEEAQAIVAKVTQTVKEHAEEAERDESLECLNHLYGYSVRTRCGEWPLWHWIAVAIDGSEDVDQHIEAKNVLQKHDIMIIDGAGPLDPGGIVLMNTSPVIKKIFERTRWEGGWRTALRQLPGVTNFGNRAVRFPSGGSSKATVLPMSLKPDKAVTPEDPWTLRAAEDAA